MINTYQEQNSHLSFVAREAARAVSMTTGQIRKVNDLLTISWVEETDTWSDDLCFNSETTHFPHQYLRHGGDKTL